MSNNVIYLMKRFVQNPKLNKEKIVKNLLTDDPSGEN